MTLSDSDAIRLEHRLTKIEATGVALQSDLQSIRNLTSQVALQKDVTEIKGLVQAQNSKVATHMENDAVWQAEHGEVHATQHGYLLGALILVANVASAVIVKVFLK